MNHELKLVNAIKLDLQYMHENNCEMSFSDVEAIAEDTAVEVNHFCHLSSVITTQAAKCQIL